jgi:hypothetical protein
LQTSKEQLQLWPWHCGRAPRGQSQHGNHIHSPTVPLSLDCSYSMQATLSQQAWAFPAIGAQHPKLKAQRFQNQSVSLSFL